MSVMTGIAKTLSIIRRVASGTAGAAMAVPLFGSHARKYIGKKEETKCVERLESKQT